MLTLIIEYEVEGMVENLHAGNYGGIERGAARTFLQILIKLLDEIDKIIGINPTTESEYANAVSLTYINSGDEKRSTIPNCAIAKLDVWYVDEGVLSKINDVLKKKASENKITYSIEQCEAGYYNEPDYKFVEKLIEIIDSVTLKKTSIKKYCGAYLPINKMESIQGTKYIIPFAQEDENNHSPNENISLEHIKYGMKIVKEILICSKNEWAKWQ